MPRVGTPDATMEQTRFGCPELKSKKYFRTKAVHYLAYAYIRHSCIFETYLWCCNSQTLFKLCSPSISAQSSCHVFNFIHVRHFLSYILVHNCQTCSYVCFTQHLSDIIILSNILQNVMICIGTQPVHYTQGSMISDHFLCFFLPLQLFPHLTPYLSKRYAHSPLYSCHVFRAYWFQYVF